MVTKRAAFRASPRHAWIMAGFGTVAVLLFVSAIASWYQLAGWASDQEREKRSLSTRWCLMHVMSLLADAETGQRGFIITGDESFLVPSARAFQEIPVEMERLGSLLGSNESSGQQLQELERLVEVKLQTVRSNIQARREQGFALAEKQVSSKVGNVTMDSIRRHIGQMDLAETKRLENWSAATDATARRARMVILAANVLALMTAGFSAEQVRRGFVEARTARAAVMQANRELEANVDRRTAELRDALARLEAENRQRKELQTEMLRISEREQRRISEDLHDGQAQNLAGALHLITAHLNRLSAAGSAEVHDVEMLKQLIRECLEQARSVAQGLYPVKDTPNGLMVALSEFAARTRKMYGVSCELEFEGDVLCENHSIASNLFRIAQEAVSNAVKHSGCRTIQIRLRQAGERVELEVSDAGRGLPPGYENRLGLGFRMMRHRAESIGGTLTILTPVPGTIVRCAVPAPPSAAQT